MTEHASPPALPALLRWSGPGRVLVFALSSTSIGCLLVEFYGLCSMRAATLAALLPAMAALALLALHDRARGEGRLWRAVAAGAAAGFAAACAYDLFRLPFVFAREWGIDSVVPAMNLFKVFPRFGAMILGETVEQATYSLPAHFAGWAYHFSNGATFGTMYLALIGDPRRRSWGWAVVMALGLEAAMLLTPYTGFFGIPVGARFVAVTLAAHLVFGVCLGLAVRKGATFAVQQP
ncbi:MAG: hypothetical protein HYY93_00620 [Planctomycetes bacterium]|nr:hypothetical protein [Planctomycetota bacterium]